jgi:ribosomal protein L37E
MSNIKVQVPVQIFCAKCGKKALQSETLDDTSPVTCSACGAQAGTLGDVKKAAAQSVANAAIDQFKNTLRDTFGNSFRS